MYLLWRGQEQVAATDDFSDSHKSIVHYYCQLVCPGTILAADNVVSTMLCQIDVVLTIVPICEGYCAVGDDEAGGGL